MFSFILTFSPEECQSKSFEKINTLLSAIFKFCITKNLFKFCNLLFFLYNKFFMVLIADFMNETGYYLWIVKMSAHDISMT